MSLNLSQLSDFYKQSAHKYPAFAEALAADPTLMPQPLGEALDQNALMKSLRLYRYQALMAITSRDILGHNSPEQTLIELSDTADYLIEQAQNQCARLLGFDLSLGVLAMGKLGAHELNFSSDIDLIFVLFSGDESQATRLGQSIIQVLNQKNVDGFVYRVDMRLRPFGDAGPLVMRDKAMLAYYQKHGRDWERYALMKARFVGVAHSKSQCDWFNQLQQYIYRPYRDYSVREAIVTMYKLIQKEHRDQRLATHVKLGPGGIREVEFLLQSLQLTHGGQKLLLRNPSVLLALKNLVQEHLMQPDVAQELRESYLFLRAVENRIQMQEDRQEHHLPTTPARQQSLVAMMGFSTWDDFLSALSFHRERVIQHRRTLLDIDDLSEVTTLVDPMDLNQDLCQLAIKYPQLKPVLPALSAAAQGEGEVELAREIAQLIAKRQPYLSLIKNEHQQLRQLFKFLSDSPYLKRLVMAYPRLMGVLLSKHMIEPFDRVTLQTDFHERIARRDDPQQYLEVLRDNKLLQLVRIVIADLERRYPLMRISDFLTELAEVVVSEAEQLAWSEVTKRYGMPLDCSDADHSFVIVAYGKLGGLELSYTSDLDLVFLYAQSEGETEGPRSISNSEFYAKLAQKILFYLQTKTVSGSLYEVDNRLRPEGSAGLLVSQIDAFEKYQKEKAWTWEHQSLVRARAICGPSKLCERFEAVRQSVLSHKRKLDLLKKEVGEMREKMRKTLYRPGEPLDLKQVPGGLVDIEFYSQYLALAFSHQQPSLIRYSDNIRILEAAGDSAVIDPEVAQELCRYYRAYRKALHHQSLREHSDDFKVDSFQVERERVCELIHLD